MSIKLAKDLPAFNASTQTYVIPRGTGYSTIGYQYVWDRCKMVRDWLIDANEPIPGGIPDEPMERLKYYNVLMVDGACYSERSGKLCPAELHPQLIGMEGQTVRVTYHGADAEEPSYPKRFKVGRSTGWMPCHLFIRTSRSRGGEAIHSSLRFKTIEVIG